MKINKVTKNWYKLSTKDQHGKKLVWFAPTRAEVRQKYYSWFRMQRMEAW